VEGDWPLLPNKPRGVPRVNDRRVLNGILWRFRTGSPWRTHYSFQLSSPLTIGYYSERAILNEINHWFIPFDMELLTQVGISAVTAIGAAWVVFQFFGKPLLDNYFDARKRALEHHFNVLMDRASKLHQFEFTVLPELWRKMSLALSAIVELTAADRIYPATRGMNEGELNTFLENAPLLDWEKWLIRDHPKKEGEERDRKLANMLDWARYRRSLALAEEFRSYLMTQSIFVSASLGRELNAIGQKMTDAISEYRRFLEERQAGREAPLELCRHIQDNWMQWAGVVQAELQTNLRTNDKTQ
jgi:transposase